jgi:glycosyltransferase involved in cell wall biosynthesis
MQHIVIISTSYPTTHDGSEAAGSFVADFAVQLAQQVRVTVIAPSLQTSREQLHENLAIYRFQVPHLPLSALKAYYPPHWYKILATLRAGTRVLEQLAKTETIDHIFALWVLPSGYWAQQVGRKYQIPYSTWALGSDIWSLGKIPVLKTWLKSVLQGSQVNFADGYLLQAAVMQLSNTTCHFLPSTRQLTIEKTKILATHPPYKLAFLGRWHPNKGIDLLLDSLAQLTAQDWDKIAEIQICGGGVLERKVTDIVGKLQQQGFPITLRGYLTKAEAVALFTWADWVLLPSRIESIPVVFSDALKCRCPIVSMPVGDLPRLVTDYQVGVLATAVSAAAFATAIQNMLTYSPQAFASQLDHAAQDFSLEHAVARFLQFISRQ